jgi:prephenate dehydrogenase
MTLLPVIQTGKAAPGGSEPIFGKIGIVGLGLIGGSIALAARELWPAALVIAVDNKDVLETAMRLHAIDVAADDMIVDENVRTAAVVTDTGSTKRDIVNAGRRLPARFTFVGGHPLGGAAQAGLEHARPDLFKGRPWLFTPADDRGGESLEKLLAFVSAMGAEPRVVTASAHDQTLAFLSHLPQLTASALMQVVGDAVGADGLSLAGRGLVDTTRLASSPADIWKDIAATNSDEIRKALDTLIGVLTELRNDLTVGERLPEIFDAAGRWRRLLQK